MLGHIAIASLGGYFAQERTGKVIDTYHPARCVPLRGVHWHTFSRAAGTSDYDKVFSNTYAYSKVLFRMPTNNMTFPTILVLGTPNMSSAAARTWVSAGASVANGGQYEIRHEETYTALAPYEIDYGELVAETYRGDPHLYLFRLGESLGIQPEHTRLFETGIVVFRVGYNKSTFFVDFYAESIENDDYHYHWFRQAMKSTNGESCALFEHFTKKALVEL